MAVSSGEMEALAVQKWPTAVTRCARERERERERESSNEEKEEGFEQNHSPKIHMHPATR